MPPPQYLEYALFYFISLFCFVFLIFILFYLFIFCYIWWWGTFNDKKVIWIHKWNRIHFLFKKKVLHLVLLIFEHFAEICNIWRNIVLGENKLYVVITLQFLLLFSFRTRKCLLRFHSSITYTYSISLFYLYCLMLAPLQPLNILAPLFSNLNPLTSQRLITSQAVKWVKRCFSRRCIALFSLSYLLKEQQQNDKDCIHTGFVLSFVFFLSKADCTLSG